MINLLVGVVVRSNWRNFLLVVRRLSTPVCNKPFKVMWSPPWNHSEVTKSTPPLLQVVKRP
jgi:hypothetical protein